VRSPQQNAVVDYLLRDGFVVLLARPVREDRVTLYQRGSVENEDWITVSIYDYADGRCFIHGYPDSCISQQLAVGVITKQIRGISEHRA
jgi:hypothetical protein